MRSSSSAASPRSRSGLSGAHKARLARAVASAPRADRLAWCIAQGWITLQRDGSENLLLIRCKPLEGSPEAPPDGADSTNKTIGLSPPNPDLSTEAREFF